MYKADLHVHTEVSDCSERTEDILRTAKEIGLTHIAFTDHDTTACAKEHVELAKQYGITAIPAVEMSAFDEAAGKKVHILGYGYREGSRIEAIGSETLKKRDANCRKQIKILQELGYHIPLEEVEKRAGACIYKQHILKWLYDSGQSEELFGDISKHIFKNGGPCDFDISYPDAVEVIKAIKADGASAVLAHPGQQDVFHLIPKFAEAGLDGMEYNHHSHKEEDKARVKKEAGKYGLFLTGGSDYHGIYEKGETKLGSYLAPEESICLFNTHLT